MAREHRQSPTLEVNAGTPVPEKTVVVLGAYRGGTSMVAAVLKELGVFMGAAFSNHPEYDNFEDLEFQNLLRDSRLVDGKIKSGDPFSEADFRISAELKVLIRRRNQDHRFWGWKFPGTVLWLLHSPLAQYLRNPHLITVFRDPLAICQHELDVGRIRPNALRKRRAISFQWVSKQIEWLSDYVMRCDYPHLLVSYEQIQRGGEGPKTALVDSLLRFLAPLPGESCREAALQAIGRVHAIPAPAKERR